MADNHDPDGPLGTHPLDWFVHAELDANAVKRRKLEQAELKQFNLLEKISSKKKQVHAAATNSPLTGNTATTERSTLLRFRPTNGRPFYQIASPDCFDYGYVEVEDVEVPPRKEEAFRRAARRRAIALPPPAPAASANDTSSVLPSTCHADGLVKKAANPDDKDACQLWAEKYQPRSFLELLTEDEQNKVVLTWLKLWDQCVFKRNATHDLLLSDYYQSMMEVEEHPPHLPKKKLLLLYGPSGCCKTTLAKICALQAGYQPVFIDASEFPNAAKFKETIAESIGTRQFSFKATTNKPTCPIIENLENASKDVVNALINEFAKEKPTSKKQKSAPTGVRRPIMLVSNNFFSSSLRNLRPFCFAVHITHLNKKRAVSRLEKICAVEQLEVKRSLLVELFDQYNGDLRQCLNNLQFLCSVWWKDIGAANQIEYHNAEVSIFDAMNLILTTNGHYHGNKMLTPVQRSQLISNMISRRSDLDLIYHGIFYNIALVGRLRSFQRARVCSLLAGDELLRSFINRSQNWSLMRYTSSTAILIHFSISTYVSKRVSYNLGFMKFTEKEKECRAVLESFGETVKPLYRLSPCAMQLELLPALSTIIQPKCHLSATQFKLCNDEETRIIHRIVDIMAFYGLTYATAFDNSSFDLKLDPPIDAVVTYQIKESTTNALNNTARKFISQLLSRKRLETEAARTLERSILSQQQNVEPPVDDAHKRPTAMPGYEFLNRNWATTNDVIYITTTKFQHRQGNAQAIRCTVLNKNLFPID